MFCDAFERCQIPRLTEIKGDPRVGEVVQKHQSTISKVVDLVGNLKYGSRTREHGNCKFVLSNFQPTAIYFSKMKYLIMRKWNI